MVKNSAVAPVAHHVHILSSPCVSVVYWTYLCYGNGMKSERLVVQVEPKLKEALERYSKTSGVPISEFVRRAIVEALKKVK
jgi:Ribbon-helix-helix domain